jgi:hypothetical protein
MSNLEDPQNKKVKIIALHPTPVPNSLGSLSLVLYGLGDDGHPYIWNTKDKKWIPVT